MNIRFSLFFGAVHLDSEGKAIHRTEGGLNSEGAIERQVALAESIRRNTVAARIEAGREAINSCHFISEDVLGVILTQSPFVPNDLLLTFCRGFSRLFQGDFIGALYVLTPLLENSLRHVLKGYGYDVTTFDDDDQTQEDRAISSLFGQMRPEMEQIFSKRIVADIDHVFLSKVGPSLRHRLAHGLLHDASAFGADALYGSWLIFQLCCLPFAPLLETVRGFRCLMSVSALRIIGASAIGVSSPYLLIPLPHRRCFLRAAKRVKRVGSALKEQPRTDRVTLLCSQESKVAQASCGPGVLGTKNALIDCQRTLIELLRQVKLAPSSKDTCQIIQCGGRIRVLGTEAFLIHRQCFFVEVARLGSPPGHLANSPDCSGWRPCSGVRDQSFSHRLRAPSRSKVAPP